MGEVDRKAVRQVDHGRGELPAAEQGAEREARRRVQEGVEKGPDRLDDTVDAALIEQTEASGRVAERPRNEDPVAGLRPVPDDGRSDVARDRHRDHDLVGLGQVPADEGHARVAGRAAEAGHEQAEPALLDVAAQGQADQGVPRPAAHRGDVAEVDVEGLAAEQARRVVGQAKILALDEDVGRQQEPLGAPDEGRIVTDAQEDVGPLLAEGAPDPRDHASLAEIFQPHRLSLQEGRSPPGTVPSGLGTVPRRVPRGGGTVPLVTPGPD